MKKFITSSVKKNLNDAVAFAKSLGVNLEISRFPGMSRINTDFEAILSDMKSAVKNFDGEVSLHALFSDLNPASRDGAIREIAKMRFEQSLRAALEINARTIVFHSGNKATKHHGSRQNFIDGSIAFWANFVKQLEKYQITASIENVLEREPDTLVEIVKTVNSPYLKFTLDTGHANLCSLMQVSDWIMCYGQKLHHMHIHNNFKTNDDHAGLTNGSINFEFVIKTLLDENLSPNIVFEIFDESELVDSLEYFSNIERKFTLS